MDLCFESLLTSLTTCLTFLQCSLATLISSKVLWIHYWKASNNYDAVFSYMRRISFNILSSIFYHWNDSSIWNLYWWSLAPFMHEVNLIMFPEGFWSFDVTTIFYIRRYALALGYTEHLHLMWMVTCEIWSLKIVPVTYFVLSCY